MAKRSLWSSKVGFLLPSAGSAVGLVALTSRRVDCDPRKLFSRGVVKNKSV